MTELEAVNIMLECINEAPVPSLPSTLPEAVSAQTVLARTSRQVQTKGWGFNTETNYEVSLGVDNSITIPATALKIDLTNVASDTTLVGGKIYDKKNKTFDLSRYSVNGKVKCDITWFRSFTDLPEYAQNYISIRAGRVLARRFIGSDVLEQFSAQDEFDALTILNEADNTTTDYNLFNNPESLAILGAY